MKYRKSHFRFTSDQRNGIFYLLLLILIFQLAFYFWSNRPDYSEVLVDANTIATFEAERDSLMALQQQKDSAQIFKYNPNYLNDYRGYQLGMSVVEIDKLLDYRKSGKYVNSEKEFQKITGVSDSLMIVLRPQLKFSNVVTQKKEVLKKKIEKRDINSISAEDLKVVSGVGEVLSKRIIKYRDLLQGFTYEDQLKEVYHLKPEIATKIWDYFEIGSIPEIQRININTATFNQLLSIAYIDYELARKIMEYRDMVEEIHELNELLKIDGFPIEKLNRITLYLSVD